MTYPVLESGRLYCRDLYFLAQYLKENWVRNSSKQLIICNSYPKSGTHLLYQILYSMPGLQRWNDIVSVQSLCGIMNTDKHIRWKVGTAPDHAIVRSHLMCTDEILNILSDFNCKLLFIYRDLRDVAMSHASWVIKEPRIFLHPIYQQAKSFDQQLMYSIKGVPLGTPFSSNLSQPDIGQDFLRWKGWLEYSGCLSIRFEDLVGERGGGSEEKRMSLVSRIADYLELSLPVDLKQFSSNKMDPEESGTFRKGNKGAVGTWKKAFKDCHKQAFKQVAGDLLIELGYEQNLNW